MTDEKEEKNAGTIKSYGEGSFGENVIVRWDEWLHFSFYYEDITDFTILVHSSHRDDGKAIEKAIVGFCDTIVKKHPGKIFDKEKIEIIKIWKDPSPIVLSDGEYMPEGRLPDGLKHFRGLVNLFDLRHPDDYEIELITYQKSRETIGIDVLKEAFTKFAEIYAKEKHIITP